MRLILASQSPRRRELLSLIGLDYEAVVSDVIEDNPKGISPDALVEQLALLKAREVSSTHPLDCVIGADTIVYIDDEIIGKPVDEADAFNILSRLQGRTHKVYTGVAVISPSGEDIRHDITLVTFAPMSEDEIRDYIKTREPMDKAGAYGIQGPGGIFIERIEGSYFTVIGMPLHILYRMLKKAGVELLP